MKQSEINRRREQVSILLIKGKSENQIAKELNVSRSTIVRDVSALKKSSQNWLEGLAKDGFIWEYKLALDKIKNHGAELAELSEKATEIVEKIQLIKARDDNAKLYLQLLAEAPAISAFKKALNSKGIANVSPS